MRRKLKSSRIRLQHSGFVTGPLSIWAIPRVESCAEKLHLCRSISIPSLLSVWLCHARKRRSVSNFSPRAGLTGGHDAQARELALRVDIASTNKDVLRLLLRRRHGNHLNWTGLTLLAHRNVFSSTRSIRRSCCSWSIWRTLLSPSATPQSEIWERSSGQFGWINRNETNVHM